MGRKEWGYDMDDPNDRAMVLDQPFSMLNKAGRKAKRHQMKIDKLW